MITKPLLTCLFLLFIVGCNQPPPITPQDEPTPLTDGIYLVQRWTIDRDDLFPLFDGERFVEYDEAAFFELQDEEVEPVKYIALSETEFIPFELDGPPDAIRQEDGRFNVGLTVSSDMAQRMKQFSRQYLGRQVAMVIGGEIVTLHKVRAIIDGGQVQISRCTDRGCDLILGRLADDDQ